MSATTNTCYTTHIADILSWDEIWLADCKLVVKKGKVWKAQSTKYYNNILPHEHGKFSWHAFDEDTIKWAYSGGLD
jgi:hypothetical protein